MSDEIQFSDMEWGTDDDGVLYVRVYAERHGKQVHAERNVTSCEVGLHLDELEAELRSIVVKMLPERVVVLQAQPPTLDADAPDCDDCGQLIAPHWSGTIVLDGDKIGEMTMHRFGRVLCAPCAGIESIKRVLAGRGA